MAILGGIRRGAGVFPAIPGTWAATTFVPGFVAPLSGTEFVTAFVAGLAPCAATRFVIFISVGGSEIELGPFPPAGAFVLAGSEGSAGMVSRFSGSVRNVRIEICTTISATSPRQMIRKTRSERSSIRHPLPFPLFEIQYHYRQAQLDHSRPRRV